MKRFAVALFGCMLCAGGGSAKEFMDVSVIESYLTETNPYVYTAVGQQYVARARAEATAGTLDTRLGLKYDNKRYPISDGEFTDVFVEKPTESGVELLLGYRKAEGVQEYNNIKTGEEGEMRVGVRVPVFALFEGMNDRTYRVRTASLEAAQSGFAAKDNLRLLRFDVFSSYYTLLYRKEAAQLEAGLLERARKRENYVGQKVEVGELPAVEALEVRRQMLSREQRRIEADNAYETALRNFLRYLGLTREAFEARYALPPLPTAAEDAPTLEAALAQAYAHRPDLKVLQYETDRYEIRDDYIAVEKYPRFNVALYGVHDFEYDNGFKVSLDMDFPIERRGYHGKKSEIQKGKRAVHEAMTQRRIDIETGLSNRFDTLRALQQNLENAEGEIDVALQLEAAERKKFRLGAGDLILVNRRELDTLEARLKKLAYALRLQVAVLEIRREIGGTAASDALEPVR